MFNKAEDDIKLWIMVSTISEVSEDKKAGV